MSIIRQLLGLSFFKREPWRFPESQVSRSGGVVISNSRTLRRERPTSDVALVIDKEVIPGLSAHRSTKPSADSGEKLPLHVKLRSEQSGTKTIVSRRRKYTRLRSSQSNSNQLNNILFLNGSLNSEQALSVGYAAVELGFRHMRVIAPHGRDAIEQLRIFRTIATRFNISLIIAVSTTDDLDLCLNWSDFIELEVYKEGDKRELLRRVLASDKFLALRRGDKLTLEEFVRVTSLVQLESHKQLLIFESGSSYSMQGSVSTFCVGLIQRIKDKTGAEVVLDLTNLGRNAPLSVLLSGVASGVNGLVLSFDHKKATESFEELQCVTQKLEAIKSTLNAVSQIN